MPIDGEPLRLPEPQPGADDEISLGLEHIEQMLRTSDEVDTAFAQWMIAACQQRIARMRTVPDAVGTTDARVLFDLLLGLTETVERLPQQLRTGWQLGNYVLPVDMPVRHVLACVEQIRLTLREAAGQYATLLRIMTPLGVDAPLLEQMENMPAHLAARRTERANKAASEQSS